MQRIPATAINTTTVTNDLGRIALLPLGGPVTAGVRMVIRPAAAKRLPCSTRLGGRTEGNWCLALKIKVTNVPKIKVTNV
jgi:hypothetical protein